MPVYEYKCNICKTITETLQKINDDPLTNCNKCGKDIIMVISGGYFILKGKGWAKDSYIMHKKKDIKIENKS